MSNWTDYSAYKKPEEKKAPSIKNAQPPLTGSGWKIGKTVSEVEAEIRKKRELIFHPPVKK